MNGIAVFFNHVVDFAKARGIGVDEALAETKAMGFNGLTLDLAFLLGDEGENYDRLIGASGLRVMGLWASADFVHCDAAHCENVVDTLLATADRLGCGNVLVLPGTFYEGDDKKVGLPKIYDGLNSACEKAKKYGLDVTIEDFGIGDPPNGNIAGCAEFFKYVPELKFTFDTGNFTLFHEFPADAYETFKGRISYVHLKDKRFVTDANGKTREEETPIGDGDLELGKLMQRLVADGYRGDFSAEHFGVPDQGIAMRRSAAFCHSILDGIQR